MRELLTTDTLLAFGLLNLLLLALYYRFRHREPWQFTLGYHALGLVVWSAILGQQMSASGWNAWNPRGAGEPALWIATSIATGLVGVTTYLTSGKRPE